MMLLLLAAVTLFGQSADQELTQALSLARSGQLEEAKRALNSARLLHPADPRFALELAGVEFKLNNKIGAKRFLRDGLRLDAQSEYGNTFLGYLFLLDGNLPATLKYWNRAGRPLLQSVTLQPVPGLHPLLLDRALLVSGGQVLTAGRLRWTEANLDRLAVFSTYQWALSPVEDQRYDLTLRSMDRSPPLKRWLSILPFVRGLPYQTVFVDLPNLGHRALNFDALARWDSQKQRYGLNVESPVRLSPRWNYRLGIDARDENWDLRRTYSGGLNGLNLRKASVDAGSSYGLTSSLEWTVGVRGAYRDFRNADASPFFRNGWSFELRSGLSGILWRRPENRVTLSGSALVRSGRMISRSDAHYNGAELSSKLLWMPQAKGDDWVVSARGYLGKLFGNPPFDELYMLGMERDNGLWMRGHVGTRDGRKGNAPLGTEYGIIQTELDRTIFRLPFVRLQAGPFLDTGRVGDPSGSFGSKLWMVDSGVQAKVKVMAGFTFALIYGRDLRQGRGVFYTSVSR